MYECVCVCICMWYDESVYWADDENDNFFQQYDAYKKRKTQKAQIKKLM